MSIFLGLGMGLSAVQAGNMMVKMAVAGDMDASGGECSGCGGDDAVKAGNCVSICASSAFVMPAPAEITSRIETTVSFPPDMRSLHGIPFSPDPGPPRSTTVL